MRSYCQNQKSTETLITDDLWLQPQCTVGQKTLHNSRLQNKLDTSMIGQKYQRQVTGTGDGGQISCEEPKNGDYFRKRKKTCWATPARNPVFPNVWFYLLGIWTSEVLNEVKTTRMHNQRNSPSLGGTRCGLDPSISFTNIGEQKKNAGKSTMPLTKPCHEVYCPSARTSLALVCISLCKPWLEKMSSHRDTNWQMHIISIWFHLWYISLANCNDSYFLTNVTHL